MPGMTGLELVREVIDHVDRQRAAAAGADDRARLDADRPRRLQARASRTSSRSRSRSTSCWRWRGASVQSHRLQTEKQYLISERDAEFNHYGIVGRSRVMQEVLQRVRAGGADQEHGADHRRDRHRQGDGGAAHPPPSAQREMPLIKVNCAAIPDTLLESELFGHVRGAFTGATMTKRGKFALADGGSIFLDEIGTHEPGRPVEAAARAAGARVRAARRRAHAEGGRPRDRRHQPRPEAAGREGKFQEDLYYRLNVIPIVLPPLRERPDDIPRADRPLRREAPAAHRASASSASRPR